MKVPRHVSKIFLNILKNTCEINHPNQVKAIKALKHPDPVSCQLTWIAMVTVIQTTLTAYRSFVFSIWAVVNVITHQGRVVQTLLPTGERTFWEEMREHWKYYSTKAGQKSGKVLKLTHHPNFVPYSHQERAAFSTIYAKFKLWKLLRLDWSISKLTNTILSR